jgi:HK97 family phage portal protein
MFLHLFWSLMEYGNAFALAYRNDREEISALHPLPARYCRPYIDPETKAIFYAVGGNPLVGEIDAMIPARNVLHVRLHCPRHPLEGVSPIEFAAMSMETHNSIAASQNAHFCNYSRTVGMLGTDMTLTSDQMRQLRLAWEEQTTGDNQGNTPILGNGIKFHSMQANATDSQLIESLRFTVEDVARAYRVPLPLVGDLQDATLNNGETLLRYWLSTGLGFTIEHMEKSLTRFFGMTMNESVDLDTDFLLRMDTASRVDSLTKAVSQGLMTPNEARAKEHLSRLDEGGDDAFMQRQNTPVSLLSQLAAAELESANQPQPEPAPIPEPDQEVDKVVALMSIKKAMNQ